MAFPVEGVPFREIEKRLKVYEKKSHMLGPDLGKNLTGSYHLYGMPDVVKVAKEALFRFLDSNTANPGEQGVREMSREVISMIASMWGSPNARGFISAGGTESNFTAILAARNMAKGKKGSVVIPSTSHPSIAKTCYMLELEPIMVPAKEDFRADVDATRKAVREDTIALIATAGTWPFATIDPIKELGEIAEEKSLYFHVDAAMAGFLCPWLRKSGYDIPEFGFEVPGVTSVASDPHKLGYTTYPAGCLMLKDEEHLPLASWSYSSTGHHEYTTFGLLGSRPGHAIAVAYAVFNYLGEKGYTRLALKNMKTTQSIIDEAQKIPDLSVANPDPKVNLATIYSKTIDLTPIQDSLNKKGWVYHRNDGKPKTVGKSIVVWLYPYAEKIWPSFIADLKAARARV